MTHEDEQVAPLRDEVERLRQLNARQAAALDELRKPVQEHCRIWHLPALQERDAAESALRQVRELADELDSIGHHWSGSTARELFDLANRIRVLARVGAADTQPEGAGEQLSHGETWQAGSNGDTAPEVTSWIDRMGDVWTFDEDGIGHSPETAPFSRKYVERKWGPLRPDPSTTPADTAPEPTTTGAP